MSPSSRKKTSEDDFTTPRATGEEGQLIEADNEAPMTRSWKADLRAQSDRFPASPENTQSCLSHFQLLGLSEANQDYFAHHAPVR